MSEYGFIFPCVTFTANSAIVPDSLKCAILYGILMKGKEHGKENLTSGLLLISQINHQYVITGEVEFDGYQYAVEVRLYRADRYQMDLARRYDAMPESYTIPQVDTGRDVLGGMTGLFKGLDRDEYYPVGSVEKFELLSPR